MLSIVSIPSLDVASASRHERVFTRSLHYTFVTTATAVRRADTGAQFYRPELDVVRFGAFALVFLHHALSHSSADYVSWGASQWAASAIAAAARAGAWGVDLFFALSAYLITELLLREQRARGTIDIRAFYLRRILRIWPLYYFALLVLLPALSTFLPGERLPVEYYFGFPFLGGNCVIALCGDIRSARLRCSGRYRLRSSFTSRGPG